MKRSVLFCQRDFGAFAQELHRAAYSPNVNNQRVNAIATMSVGTNRSDTFPADLETRPLSITVVRSQIRRSLATPKHQRTETVINCLVEKLTKAGPAQPPYRCAFGADK